MHASPEVQELARRLLARMAARRETRMGAELIDAAKQFTRLGAKNAAMAALRLIQLEDLRHSAATKLTIELRLILAAS